MLHVCLLTYASDLTLLGSVLARHEQDMSQVAMASLDHAMWFHRPFRADEWLLYECRSPSASGAGGSRPAGSSPATGDWWSPRCRRGWSACSTAGSRP